jgi:hypothetical protein
MGALPLRRVGGTAKALVVLLLVYAAVDALGIIVNRMAVDPARDFLRGELSEDELTDELAPFVISSAVLAFVMVAIIVLTMIWMFCVAANHRRIGRQTTWAPGFAIGGWFLPPILFVIPFLMLMEMWKASDPGSPPQSHSWKHSSMSPLVPIWWVLYGVIPLVLLIGGGNPLSSFGEDTQDFAEQIDEQQTMMLFQSLAAAAAAIVFMLLVRALTDRHTRLTGEATTR